MENRKMDIMLALSENGVEAIKYVCIAAVLVAYFIK